MIVLVFAVARKRTVNNRLDPVLPGQFRKIFVRQFRPAVSHVGHTDVIGDINQIFS